LAGQPVGRRVGGGLLTRLLTRLLVGRSPHLKGLVLTTAGVLVISPDTLLIRLVGADVWTLSLWRDVLLAAVLGSAQLLRHRGRVLTVYRDLGRRGLLAGGLSGIGTIFFVAAVSHTTVANVLIIIGAAPLIAALLRRTFLGEHVPVRTWIAILGAVGGIAVTVGGSIQGPQPGDLFALGAVLFLSAYLTTVRSAGDVDMTPCIVISGLVAAALAWPFAEPGSVPSEGVVPLLLSVIVIPLSFALITLGPRYLPAHEVALIGLLETILGTYLVWLVLDEHPGSAAIFGGAIVMVVLAAHSVVALRAD
jgi:drug/metabolite transporter (DMT)-like permease